MGVGHPSDIAFANQGAQKPRQGRLWQTGKSMQPGQGGDGSTAEAFDNPKRPLNRVYGVVSFQVANLP